MAGKDDFFRPLEVFWTQDDTLNGSAVAYIPGVTNPGNRRPQRPKLKVKGKKTKEVQAVAPKKQPVVQNIKPRETTSTNDKQIDVLCEKSTVDGKVAKASLKDLCAEDKQRVANLIKELARLGEEQETSTYRLQSERQIFERRIQDLIDQQDNITSERKTTENQLVDCQQLLAKYQLYIQDNQEAMLVSRQNTSNHNNIPHSSRGVEMYTPKADKKGNINDQTAYDGKPHVDSRHSVQDALPHTHQVEPVSTFNNQASSHEATEKPLFQFYIEKNAPCDPVYRELSQAEVVETRRSSNLAHRNTPQSGKYTMHGQDADSSFSDRPFTRKIDEIIAKEKEGGERQDLVVPKSLFGIGPLNPPALSSTQRSEYNEQGSLQFQPLEGESSPTGSGSIVNNEAGFQVSDRNNRVNQVGFRSPVETAAYSPPYDDQQFMNYYQSLGPDERKQELFAQKTALLQEQKRLKNILTDQEQMLRSKQDQLHKQQEVQRERLKYFEQTGTFPPHHVYNDGQQSTKSGVVMNENRQPIVNNTKFLLNQFHMPFGDITPDQNVPQLMECRMQYSGNADPAIGQYHEVPNKQYVSPSPGLQASWPAPHPNEHFLERQAAEAQAAIGHKTDPMTATRTGSTSTHHSRPEHSADTPKALWSSDQQYSIDLAEVLNHSISSDTATSTQNNQKPYNGTSHLLDLVNQVESDMAPSDDMSLNNTFVLHSPSDQLPVIGRTPCKQTSTAYIDHDTGSYINESDDDDDAEESQVLEDVFFIK